MSLDSDNTVGACPEVLEHLLHANDGSAASYGADEITKRVNVLFSEFFEKEVQAFPVATGTAANSLAISCFTPSFGAVYCHGGAHIMVDECNGPEFYSGGAKLVPVTAGGTKLLVDDLQSAHDRGWSQSFHHAQPSLISITQSTEGGTVYSLGEIRAITDFARANGLAVHMDGARFCNALVTLGCSAAEMTWKAGIDVVTFGATKNGALAAEAVVFFDDEKSKEFVFRRKRAGHQFSKQRFLSAQLEAMMKDGVWRRNAETANNMATRLATELTACDGITMAYPVEANELFFRIKDEVAAKMRESGISLHGWPDFGSDCYRMVTSWCTDECDISPVIKAAQLATGACEV